MALKKQKVSISFEKGLAEDRDAYLRQDGSLAVAENVTMSHKGEVRKAPGDIAADTGIPGGFGKMMSGPHAPLGGFEDAVYSFTDNNWREVDGGEKPAIVRDFFFNEIPLKEVPTRVDLDVSYDGSELYVCYNLSDGLYYTVLSTDDYSEILSPVRLDTNATHGIVICLNGSNIVYYVDGADIKRQKVSNVGTSGAATIIYTTGLTDPAIHGLPNVDKDLANIFVTSGGAVNTEVIKDDTITPVTGTIYAGGGEIFGTGNIGDDLYTVQQYVPASGAGVFAAKWTGFLDAATVTPTTPSAVSGDLTSGSGTTINATIVKDPGSSEIWVAHTIRNVQVFGSTRFHVSCGVVFKRLDSALSTLATSEVPDIVLTGQGFQHGTSRPFFPVATLAQRNQTYAASGTRRVIGYRGYIVCPVFGESWGAVASCRYLKEREAYSVSAYAEDSATATTLGSQVGYFLCSSVNVSGNIVTGVPTTGGFDYDANFLVDTQYGGGIGVIKTISDNFQKNPVLGNYSFINSGVNYTYDGRNIFENSLHTKPDWEVQQVTTGAPSSPVVNYSMFCTFRYTDARGNFHRSEASEIFSDITYNNVGANDVNVGMYITIPTPISNIAFEDDGREYYIEYWLSVDNSDFYLVNLYQIAGSDIAVAGEVNDTLLVDASDDLWKGSTFGVWPGDLGEVIPDVEPSFQASGVFTRNVFGVPFESKNELWISKPYDEGQVEFASTIVKRVSRDIQGFVVMDDKAVMFHSDGISYLPLAEVTEAGTGIGNTVSISVDTGINNSKSTALIDQGILYSTDRGIYILTRGLESKFIGWPTQDTLETLDIDGTQVYPKQSEVYFYLGGNSTKTVIYNYLLGQWYTSDHYTTRGTVLHDGVVYETKQGVTYTWDPDTYQKSQSDRVQTVETDWIHMSDIQDFKRLYHVTVLGALDKGAIRVKTKYDYDETVVDTFTFNTDANADGVEDNVGGSTMQFRIRPSRQKVEAIKLRFEEVTLANDSVRSGFSLKNLLLTVGLKESEYKRLSKEKKR